VYKRYFCRDFTKYTVIYSVCIWLWPTLPKPYIYGDYGSDFIKYTVYVNVPGQPYTYHEGKDIADADPTLCIVRNAHQQLLAHLKSLLGLRDDHGPCSDKRLSGHDLVLDLHTSSWKVSLVWRAANLPFIQRGVNGLYAVSKALAVSGCFVELGAVVERVATGLTHSHCEFLWEAIQGQLDCWSGVVWASKQTCLNACSQNTRVQAQASTHAHAHKKTRLQMCKSTQPSMPIFFYIHLPQQRAWFLQTHGRTQIKHLVITIITMLIILPFLLHLYPHNSQGMQDHTHVRAHTQTLKNVCMHLCTHETLGAYGLARFWSALTWAALKLESSLVDFFRYLRTSCNAYTTERGGQTNME